MSHSVPRMASRWIPSPVSASLFGIVLGVAGLGGAWRAAHRVWGLPAVLGETLMIAAALVWAVLIVLYGATWVAAREDALREAEDPVRCCFIGLAGVSTSLIAIAVLPYSHPAAMVLFAVGALFTLGFALWRTGRFWQGGREDIRITPVLYLPTVAGTFVTAIAAAGLGYPDWGRLAFGAGLFSWLAIESVLLQRLYRASPLPPALRPTLGILVAPPTVGALAYLGVTTGPPDPLAQALLGYGLLQAVLLLRLLPWIARQRFALSYWAFSFGATALGTVPLLMMERGVTGAIATLAPSCFVAANVVVVALTVRTVAFAARRRQQTHPGGASQHFTQIPAPIHSGISVQETLS